MSGDIDHNSNPTANCKNGARDNRQSRERDWQKVKTENSYSLDWVVVETYNRLHAERMFIVVVMGIMN